MASKEELRQTLRDERQSLSPESVTLMSGSIVAGLKQALNWSQIRAIHCFEPIAANNEPNVTPFINWIRTVFPTTDILTERKLNGRWYHTNWGRDLVRELPKLDAIIVPMLGFTGTSRLGYGGGYYDRFLATQPDAIKIGVGFSQGMVPDLMPEPHDVPMNMIITERTVPHIPSQAA